MKITDIRAHYLRLPQIEARTDSSQDALIVEVTTDAGITGWGEVDSCPAVIQAIVEAPMSHTLVTGLKRILVGEDPLDTTRLWHTMALSTVYYGRSGAVVQAMAGIDLALWDIKGKALGQPVWKLLGGRFRDRLRVYSSNMMQFTPEATAERLTKAVDEGFTAVKFGWEPFGQTLKGDLAYLDALREAAGPDVDIMLDVGLVWDARTTIQRARAFEPYDLFWIEEPLPPGDYRGYGRVSEAITQRLAAGEEECTLDGFVRLIDEGKIDLAQIDLTRCGLTMAMKIADYAQLRGIKVANHNFTTDINTAASLHFLAAIPNALVLEYCVEPGEISRGLSTRPFVQKDGYMAVPDEPGLGVEPNLEVVGRYLVRS